MWMIYKRRDMRFDFHTHGPGGRYSLAQTFGWADIDKDCWLAAILRRWHFSQLAPGCGLAEPSVTIRATLACEKAYKRLQRCGIEEEFVVVQVGLSSLHYAQLPIFLQVTVHEQALGILTSHMIRSMYHTGGLRWLCMLGMP